MEERFIEWTANSITSKTNFNMRMYLNTKERIIRYEEDVEKESRKNNKLCKCCYYIKDAYGFSAMTTSYCGICKESILNGSSCTNRVCDKCAESHKLCSRCGGKMEE